MVKCVTEEGRLKDEFMPAVYFESSVVIDYWMTEGMEFPDELCEGQKDWVELSHGPLAKVIQDLLSLDSRVYKVGEIRKKLLFEDTTICPVTSHAALWELQEWIAESGLKQAGSEILGAIFLQRKSKKQIGDYLKKAHELWIEEGENKHHDSKAGTSGLELLRQGTWINLSFAYAHGLSGIVVPETTNFNWPPQQDYETHPYIDPYTLAYLQLGLGDILHILLANHYGCQYFASFDTDFRRARELIEETGMSLLVNPEEILKIL